MVMYSLPKPVCTRLHRLLTRLILASPFLRDFDLTDDGLIRRAEFESCVQDDREYGECEEGADRSLGLAKVVMH